MAQQTGKGRFKVWISYTIFVLLVLISAASLGWGIFGIVSKKDYITLDARVTNCTVKNVIGDGKVNIDMTIYLNYDVFNSTINNVIHYGDLNFDTVCPNITLPIWLDSYTGIICSHNYDDSCPGAPKGYVTLIIVGAIALMIGIYLIIDLHCPQSTCGPNSDSKNCPSWCNGYAIQ